MSVTIVIPAYNEEVRLAPFLKSIVLYCVAHPHDISEIIVVDDGSRDTTAHAAQSFVNVLPRLRVISYSPNRGKGHAVKTGVMAAQSDVIIFMDADGATPIDELPKMLAALRDHDIAVGSRWMRTSETARSSWFRHFAGLVYRHYMQLYGIGEIDTMCGFKGYRAHVARDLFNSLIEPRWLFDTEIAYKAAVRRYRVKNFPIHWESKEGSKLSGLTLLKTAFQIWPLIRKIKRQEASSL